MMSPAAPAKPRRVLFAAVLALCGTLNGLVLAYILVRHPFLNQDFLGFWAYPRFTPLPDIYQPEAMMRFQQALYPGFGSFYPFTYPPDVLLLTGWLRALPYNAARAIWLLAGLCCFAAAGWAFLRRRAGVLALLASPAALLCIVLGQSSFFIGALLLGGLAALPRRPILAGLLFGLLTIKPQMGLLLPFLLLALGQWRAIAAATVTAALLVALSALVLPAQLWRLWLASLPQIQHDYFSGSTNLNIMITPAANALHLGAPPHLALALQAACTLAAAICVWAAARRGTYQAAVAVLLAASFIAQPHAYAYDLVTLPAALMLGLRRAPALAQALGLVLYIAPLLLFSPWAGYFCAAPFLAALLAVLTRLALQPPEGAISPHVANHPAL
ncbi:MAG TPA: glycosyltransferase family 87 protein [Acidocella sp.]|jgi:hypothetical protein|nr:glycosyltransferase family 87 protein [Acidocella sp.]